MNFFKICVIDRKTRIALIVNDRENGNKSIFKSKLQNCHESLF